MNFSPLNDICHLCHVYTLHKLIKHSFSRLHVPRTSLRPAVWHIFRVSYDYCIEKMACSCRGFGNDLANISHVFACRRVLTLSQSVGERLFQKGRSTAANCRHFTSLSAKETNALDLMHIFFMLVFHL